jgi:hypothetical protein
MKIIGLADGITQIVTENPGQNELLLHEIAKLGYESATFNNSIFVKSKKLKFDVEEETNRRLLTLLSLRHA